MSYTPPLDLRAYVNFNGTGTPATRGSPRNFASITDNATGDWTVNFTAAHPTANYVFLLAVRASGPLGINQSSTTAPQTGSIRLTVFGSTTGTATDTDYVEVACVGL